MQNKLLNFAEPTATQFAAVQYPRPKEESSFGLVTEALRKYWPVSLLVSSVLMAGIAYKTLKQTRIYQSGIQISIELDKGSTGVDKIAAMAGGGSSGDSSSSSDRATTIETTIQLLQSKQLIKKAIDSIPNAQLRPTIGDVMGNIKISTKPDIDILNVSYSDPSPQKVVAVLQALSTAYIDYSIIKKKAQTNSSIAFIETELPEARKRLEVSAQKIEEFRRKYRFADPETAAKGLAEYRQEIIGKLNESQVANLQAQQTQQQLSKQLGQVGLRSDSSLPTTMLTQDKNFQKLFEELNLLNIKYNQERVRFSDENLIIVDLKKKREQLQLLLKERAQQVLKRPVSDTELTNGSISNVGGSGGISLAASFTGEQAKLETTIAAQAAQQAGLRKIYEQVELQISQLPLIQKQYTELEREYKLQTQELTAFLQKLQELKIVNAEKIVPWTLLDPPELPRLPVSPDVPRQLGLGALASLLAGILAAVGLNKLDNRIGDPESVKDLTGLPILALIPKADSLQENLKPNNTVLQISTNKKSKDYGYWGFVEAIRSLALGIGFTTDQGVTATGKIVTFTSGLPKEGKSTIAFNAAVTLAELGYKVLIVDGDLYKSSVRTFCSKSPIFNGVDCFSKEGLTDVISGTHQWQDLVKRAPGIKLDALFSGPRLVNSIALLNSPRLGRLMTEWREEYDYVILDVPPILGVSDTRLLTTMVDGLVFVVGLDIAQRQSVSRAIELIASLNTTVLGVAINQVESRYTGYGNYYGEYYSQPAPQPSLSAEKVVDVRVIE